MEVFIAYKFTGEDIIKLWDTIKKISELIKKTWNSVFNSFELLDYFAQNKMSVDEIYEYCTNRLDKSDMIIALIWSDDESKWMILELERAKKLNKKIVVFIQKYLANKSLLSFATKIIEFDKMEDIYEMLSDKNLYNFS